MKTADLVDRYLEFEDRNGLFERRVLGLKFWHFARFEIYRSVLLKQLAGVGRPHDAPRLLEETSLGKTMEKLKRSLGYVRYCYGGQSLSRLTKKDVIVMSHARRIRDGDHDAHPYTDAILPCLRGSYYVLEEPTYLRGAGRVGNENLKYLDRAVLKSRLRRRIPWLSGGTAGEGETATFVELAEKLQSEFEVSINAEEFKREMLTMVRHCISLKKELEKVMDRISPRLVVEVTSYSMVNMLINAIAAERGVRTVELQHGAINRHHVAYNFHRKIKLETFPDYLFVFGENWKKAARLPLDDDRVVVTGFPYFEEKVRQYAGARREPGAKEAILFISEGLVGKEMSRLACELAGMIDTERHRIIYKLHPGERLRWRRGEYACLKDSRIEVVDSNEKSIYHYLAASRYVVGVSSTAIFESLPFSPKIFIYDAANHEYAEELYARGYAELIRSARDIFRSLNADIPDTSGIAGGFWAPNAARNMAERLRELL